MRSLRIGSTVLLLFLAGCCFGAEPRAGKQVEMKLDLGDGQTIEYLLYLPHNYEAGEKFPFMLFLHGRGESKGPLSVLKRWGPPRMIEQGKKLPYILASPRCPPETRWEQSVEQSRLDLLLDHLLKTWPIDEGRVYLTGLSLGGFGSWALAARHPDMFAAVAPLCGKGNPADGAKLVDVPIWAWHGLADTVVPPAGTEDMVKAIKAAGGTQIRYTSLEGVGHNAWSAAYATPQLFQWMNRHSLEVVEEPKVPEEAVPSE